MSNKTLTSSTFCKSCLDDQKEEFAVFYCSDCKQSFCSYHEGIHRKLFSVHQCLPIPINIDHQVLIYQKKFSKLKSAHNKQMINNAALCSQAILKSTNKIEPFLQKFTEKHNFQKVKFSKECNLHFLIAQNSQELYISFQIQNPLELISDLNDAQENQNFIHSPTHQQIFHNSIQKCAEFISSIHPGLFRLVSSLPIFEFLKMAKTRKIIFCGHSINGSLSHVCAISAYLMITNFLNEYDQNKIYSIGFGSPLYCDINLLNLLSKSNFPNQLLNIQIKNDGFPYLISEIEKYLQLSYQVDLSTDFQSAIKKLSKSVQSIYKLNGEIDLNGISVQNAIHTPLQTLEKLKEEFELKIHSPVGRYSLLKSQSKFHIQVNNTFDIKTILENYNSNDLIKSDLLDHSMSKYFNCIIKNYKISKTNNLKYSLKFSKSIEKLKPKITKVIIKQKIKSNQKKINQHLEYYQIYIFGKNLSYITNITKDKWSMNDVNTPIKIDGIPLIDESLIKKKYSKYKNSICFEFGPTFRYDDNKKNNDEKDNNHEFENEISKKKKMKEFFQNRMVNFNINQVEINLKSYFTGFFSIAKSIIQKNIPKFGKEIIKEENDECNTIISKKLFYNSWNSSLFEIVCNADSGDNNNSNDDDDDDDDDDENDVDIDDYKKKRKIRKLNYILNSKLQDLELTNKKKKGSKNTKENLQEEDFTNYIIIKILIKLEKIIFSNQRSVLLPAFKKYSNQSLNKLPFCFKEVKLRLKLIYEFFNGDLELIYKMGFFKNQLKYGKTFFYSFLNLINFNLPNSNDILLNLGDDYNDDNLNLQDTKRGNENENENENEKKREKEKENENENRNKNKNERQSKSDKSIDNNGIEKIDKGSGKLDCLKNLENLIGISPIIINFFSMPGILSGKTLIGINEEKYFNKRTLSKINKKINRFPKTNIFKNRLYFLFSQLNKKQNNQSITKKQEPKDMGIDSYTENELMDLLYKQFSTINFKKKKIKKLLKRIPLFNNLPTVPQELLIKFIRCIPLIKKMSTIQNKKLYIGVLGMQNAGKSTLINKLFGFDTKRGITDKERTVTISSYTLGNGIYVLDYPGFYDPDKQARKLTNLLNIIPKVYIFVGRAGVVDQAAKKCLTPLLNKTQSIYVCLNKIDLFPDLIFKKGTKKYILKREKKKLSRRLGINVNFTSFLKSSKFKKIPDIKNIRNIKIWLIDETINILKFTKKKDKEKIVKIFKAKDCYHKKRK
ncbi:alpha/beta-hydrolases superfamily protein [Anaeramoeba flamelloides]|uniref:Alpha/beta-hydrolases superfamily protein n=1 Tax=Anaeramoeba flamelloides TaxID=1746091 RepID=A0ABQ8X5Z8_9EUKA|nr:alpha/beta-hydrolases superfamily protein [Anaeramoeba flamelloides]